MLASFHCAGRNFSNPFFGLLFLLLLMYPLVTLLVHCSRMKHKAHLHFQQVKFLNNYWSIHFPRTQCGLHIRRLQTESKPARHSSLLTFVYQKIYSSRATNTFSKFSKRIHPFFGSIALTCIQFKSHLKACEHWMSTSYNLAKSLLRISYTSAFITSYTGTKYVL